MGAPRFGPAFFLGSGRQSSGSPETAPIRDPCQPRSNVARLRPCRRTRCSVPIGEFRLLASGPQRIISRTNATGFCRPMDSHTMAGVGVLADVEMHGQSSASVFGADDITG